MVHFPYALCHLIMCRASPVSLQTGDVSSSTYRHQFLTLCVNVHLSAFIFLSVCASPFPSVAWQRRPQNRLPRSNARVVCGMPTCSRRAAPRRMPCDQRCWSRHVSPVRCCRSVPRGSWKKRTSNTSLHNSSRTEVSTCASSVSLGNSMTLRQIIRSVGFIGTRFVH